MGQYWRVMNQWLATFEGDLERHGKTKVDEDPDDGLSFVPEVEVKLGRVVDAYDNWSLRGADAGEAGREAR